MFERFTHEARRVVVAAQDEARRTGSGHLGTGHLLLGVLGAGGMAADELTARGLGLEQAREILTDTGGPEDAGALATLGIDLASVRDAVDERFGPGAWDRAGQVGRRRRVVGRGLGRHLPFDRASRAALEGSLRAAVARGDRAIDGRHVAIALLTAPTTARRVVERAGIVPEDVLGALVIVRRPAA